ncbi:MAG: hypothetical protein HKM06_07880 [Spirochaetales bacterium]|nr:hypothetical protein [Spirochaetales bacterium]
MKAKLGGVAFLAFFLTISLSAQSLQERPLAGRLVGGASELTGGEGFLLPCEDETLSWISPQGQLVAQWSADERFTAWASVGPQRVSVIPLLSGRVVALHWGNHALRPFAQTSRDAEPSIPAVLGDAGRWLLGWNDGWVSIWSPLTGHKIDVFLGETPRAALYDPGWGFWIRTRAALVLVRLEANLTRWPLPESKNPGTYFLAQGALGTLWLGGPDGLYRFQPAIGKAVHLGSFDSPLHGIALGADDGPVVLGNQTLFFLDNTGLVKNSVALPAEARSGPILDDKGGFWVYTERGLFFGRSDGRLLRFWPTPWGGTPPLLASKGDLLWVASDWELRLLSHQSPPYLSWSQAGGSPQRSNFCHRGVSYRDRMKAWQGEPGFQVLEALLQEGTRAGQEKALELIEARQKQGTLMTDWSFANLILLGIARSGVTDVRLDNGRIVNDWPDLRLRAYRVLAQTATPEDRNELMDLVEREYEEPDQNEGVLALAHSGLDPDGELTQLLERLRQKHPGDQDLAQALLEAAQRIWTVNGPDAPSNLASLVNSLYQGNYPRVLRVQAEKLFQKMIESP